MRKISTVAAKQSRNISQQKLTIGLDLGDRSSWYCVLNESGEVVLEQRSAGACRLSLAPLLRHNILEPGHRRQETSPDGIQRTRKHLI